MPFLDVNPPLLDPDFADTFMVKRRVETVDVHGRSQVATQQFPNVVGVVTAISPNDLQRKDDYQTMGRAISVVCQFRLRGEVEGEQPDIVYWRGSNYIVKHIDNYPQFGKGFIQAECVSQDRVDPFLEPPAVGQLAFNQASNIFYSSLIG